MANLPRTWGGFEITTTPDANSYLLIKSGTVGSPVQRVRIADLPFGSGGGSSNTAVEWAANVHIGDAELSTPLVDGDIPMYLDLGDETSGWYNFNLFQELDSTIDNAIVYAPWKTLFFSVDGTGVLALNFTFQNLKFQDVVVIPGTYNLDNLSGRFKVEYWAENSDGTSAWGGEKALVLNYRFLNNGESAVFGDLETDGISITVNRDGNIHMDLKVTEGEPVSFGRLMIWYLGTVAYSAPT